MRLAGKTALIIGGGQAPSSDPNAPMGNGRATALTFAREGASVVVADRSIDSANAVAQEIIAQGGTAMAQTCDVLVEDDILAAIAQTKSTYGSLDILHNNVGLSIEAGDAPITDITADAFDHIMRLNLRAMVLAAKHALPIMR
ncbi:MAG: SDR family NAD(P)-dependent oxidoreductase, partial [Paracoccaceae bacterium]